MEVLMILALLACSPEPVAEEPACPFLGTFDVVEWGPLDVSASGWTMEFVELEDLGCDLYVETDSSFMVQLWRKRQDGDGWAFDVYRGGDIGVMRGQLVGDHLELEGELGEEDEALTYLLRQR